MRARRSRAKGGCGRAGRRRATVPGSTTPAPPGAYACAPGGTADWRPPGQWPRGRALGVPAQHAVDRALRIGQRRLGALAAEHRVLDLRIERILELRVEGQRPVAGEFVGMLELRLKHLRA